MKKIMITIVSVVFLLSIALISFLGVQAQIRNETVLVQDIILKDLENKPKGYEYSYALNGKKVYTIYSRPDEEDIDPVTGEYIYFVEGGGKIKWNTTDNQKYDYYLKIWDYNFIYENSEWRDGKGKFKIDAKTTPSNATKRGIIYSIPQTSIHDLVTIDATGTMQFETKRTGPLSFLVTLKTEDYSDISKKIWVVCSGYVQPE